MIAKVTKSQGDGALNYNLEKEQGELLDTNIIATDPKRDFKQEFDNVASKNTRVKKNVFHASLSLADGEKIDSDKFAQIGKEYMEKMGFKNTPYAIFEHTDTKNQHIHIVASRVDNDGKCISERNDHKKSQKISRELEKKYDLKPVEAIKQGYDKQKLGEINNVKYAFQNGLKSAIKQGYKEDLSKILGEKTLNQLSTMKNGTNKNLVKALNNPEKQAQTSKFLHDKKLVPYTTKKSLKDAIGQFLEDSKTLKEFDSKCEKANLYKRVLNEKYTYGGTVNDKKIYLSEKQLPKEFSYKSIQQHFRAIEQEKSQKVQEPVKVENKPIEQPTKRNGRDFSVDQQKGFLKNTLNKIVPQAKNFSELEKLCKTKNIYMQINGSNGVSFTPVSDNVANPITFKGSDIDKKFSHSNINKTFQPTQEPTKQGEEKRKEGETKTEGEKKVNKLPLNIEKALFILAKGDDSILKQIHQKTPITNKQAELIAKHPKLEYGVKTVALYTVGKAEFCNKITHKDITEGLHKKNEPSQTQGQKTSKIPNLGGIANAMNPDDTGKKKKKKDKNKGLGI